MRYCLALLSLCSVSLGGETVRMYAENKNARWMRKWRAAHPEESRERGRKWRIDNPERAKEMDRRSRENNRDRRVAYTTKWNANNPDKRSVYKKKWESDNPGYHVARDAKQRLVTVGDLTAIAKVYERAKWWRRWFDVAVDHIIPLSRSGTHEANNLQIIYTFENCRKGARLDYKPRVVFT